MADAKAVLIPLLNPNEPEALLASLHVKQGQKVKQGDLLATLETTKSAADVHAEQAGFVAGLRFKAGQSIAAGETLCYIAPSADWQPPQPATSAKADESSALPGGLRISKPALALAQQHGIDLNTLPIGPLVTEKIVRGLIPAQADASAPEAPFDPTAIIVYGGGGHGKSLIDLLRVWGKYNVIGVVDDGLQAGETVLGLSVLGGGESLTGLYRKGTRLAANAVGGIGNIAVRIKVFERLAQAGFDCPALIHPTAFVEPSADISLGAQILPHTYIGSDAMVGFGVIANTGSIISHDCVLDEYVNIAPGAILAGGVRVGAGTLIGMGVTVNLNVTIGARARIGNGATIKSDVPEGSVVRAGAIWPPD